MTSVLKDKFLKNEEMKLILKNTGTKILSEAIVMTHILILLLYT